MKYPRSPYDQEGGLVYFPRMLDKIRLKQSGQLSEEYFDMLGKGFDNQCYNFLGVKYEQIEEKTKSGLSDMEILAWCLQNGRMPDKYLINLWNVFMRKRGWRDDDGGTDGLNEYKQTAGMAQHDEVKTFFDFIDADEGRS